jgi:NitT/TauT family transport system permease protein/sulfonate transport system permease protein
VTDRAELNSRLVADGFVVVMLVVWWLTARDMPDFVLPDPLEVAQAMGQLLVDPDLLSHVLSSFLRVLAAVSVALVVAVALAALIRTGPVLSTIVERNILVVLNSFPSVGWAILGVIWFSVSPGTVIFIEAMIVLPFCLINAIEGFRQIDPELEEMGQSLSRSRVRRFLKLQLPLILPFLIAGLRIAYGIAWKIALVAELFGATSGLGWLLQQAQSRADAATVLAACLLIVVIFALVDGLVLRPLARRFSINLKEA